MGEDEMAVDEPTPVPEMNTRNIKLVAAGFFHSMAVVVNFKQTEAERAEDRRFRKEKAKAAANKGKSMSTSKLPKWLQKTLDGGDDAKKAKQEEKMEKLRGALPPTAH